MKTRSANPRVFMMDLWATVPYYTAYLSRALLSEGAALTVGSISYYLDPHCFTSRKIPLRPGFMDLVGKLQLSKTPRRVLKMLEAILNMSALLVRFLASPPNAIHVQYLPMLQWRMPLDLWFLRICRMRGIKIILTVHDLLPHDSKDRYMQTFKGLYGEMDALICHSVQVKRRLHEDFDVPMDKVSIIPHGPFFYDLPVVPVEAAESKQLIVLWQGIILPYKGVDLLLDAWNKVEASGTDASLVVAGTGNPDLLDRLRKQVEALGLKRVTLDLRFVSVEELVALYHRADIVVYPYRAISTSGALATGLALGKTIIATDLPVFRELLTHGEDALLVAPAHVEDLARAINALANDSALRQRLAANVGAMNFGENSWLDIATETLNVYRRVAA